MSDLSDERRAEAREALGPVFWPHYPTVDKALDALAPTLARWLAKERRDLAAKVEALCDQEWLCATASDGALHPAVPVEHLRALLADALPQDADSEPASVPLAAEDDSGAAVDAPGAEGLSEAQEGV